MNYYDRTQIMLINTKFPVNINYLQKQDQTLSLGGMSWEDYEKFNSEEYQGYRISYFKGYIEVTRSQFLPNLTSKILEKFVNQGFTENPLIIEQDFLKQLN